MKVCPLKCLVRVVAKAAIVAATVAIVAATAAKIKDLIAASCTFSLFQAIMYHFNENDSNTPSEGLLLNEYIITMIIGAYRHINVNSAMPRNPGTAFTSKRLFKNIALKIHPDKIDLYKHDYKQRRQMEDDFKNANQALKDRDYFMENLAKEYMLTTL